MAGEIARLIKKTEGGPSSTTKYNNTPILPPVIIEEWALPLFMKAGLQPATISTAARTDI
eukprot:1148788-Pelagomonas_calceolata.AAC.2